MKRKKLPITMLAMAFAGAVFSQNARVQVIHNCADAAASEVDVWLNNTLLLDNFAFRTASPFIDAPAGVNFDITIAGPNSTDTTNAVARFTYNLVDGETYVLVANGTVSASGYSPVQPFDIDVLAGAREFAADSLNTDVMVYHGATDAPTVDIQAGGATLVDDISYPEFNGNYLELPTNDYVIDVTDATGTVTVATYDAPLATLNLQGEALVALASGFLDPSANSNGAAFGVWVALPSGGPLVELPTHQFISRVQVIHNCADAAASEVDVWLNNTLLLDNFAFRTASPFIDAPAGVDFDITIAGPNSTDTTNAVARFTYNLVDGETYVLVANGTVSASGYSPVQPFNIDVLAGAREFASSSLNTDVMVYHGATDAPTVDIQAGGATLVDDISYPEFNTNYLELPTNDYVIDVTDATGTVTVATYDAPLATLNLQGEALVALASGFLDPSANSNGAAFGVWVALPSGGPLVELPTHQFISRVQVIHNCADAAASEVDVWLNNTLLLDNFAFRTASPFIDAPAGVDFDITIAGPNSTDTTNAVARFTYNLVDGETYVLVANGTVSASGYSPVQPFNIDVLAGAREFASSSLNTDVMVYHGATDAPTVDIQAGGATLVDNISYPEFNGNYLELPTNDYIIEVTDSTGVVTVAAYDAPLATLNLQGEALVALASGFLDPSANSNGAAFGVWVALPSGGPLVELPTHQFISRVQVIHNCADAAASEVDVWLNNTLLLDNFAFRTASPFIDAPAGVDFDITIASPNSTDTTNAIKRVTYNLVVGETYVLVANGTVSATGYSPIQPFDIDVLAGAREFASSSLNTDVMVYHGATDAPTVDIQAGGATLVDNISYPEFNGNYLELPTNDYVIDVTDATGTVTVATYDAPLATLNLQGEALVALASGFLDPSANSNGAAFGVWVALPSGGPLVELPTHQFISRVQVIHNCADAAASEVDVWLNNTLLLDNFAFRTASPFIDAPAGVDFDITIAGPNSTDTTNAVARFTYNLVDGETYVLVANGTVSASGYSPVQPFDIDVLAGAREFASSSLNTDVMVYHGATDAPTVDIQAGGATLVDDISYPEFNGNYLELPTANYVIDVTDATGSAIVASYDAPLALLNLQGEALVALASGFLDPSVNSNGPAFGIWVALPAGGNLIPLTVVTGMESIGAATFNVWPNPANSTLNIAFNSAKQHTQQVNFYNSIGEIVKTFTVLGINNASINIEDLTQGIYTIELQGDSGKSFAKFIKN